MKRASIEVPSRTGGEAIERLGDHVGFAPHAHTTHVSAFWWCPLLVVFLGYLLDLFSRSLANYVVSIVVVVGVAVVITLRVREGVLISRSGRKKTNPVGRLTCRGNLSEIDGLAESPVATLEPFIVETSILHELHPAVLGIPSLVVTIILLRTVGFAPALIGSSIIGVALYEVDRLVRGVYYRVRPGFLDVVRPARRFSTETRVQRTIPLREARISCAFNEGKLRINADGEEELTINIMVIRDRLAFARHLFVAALVEPGSERLPDDALLG